MNVEVKGFKKLQEITPAEGNNSLVVLYNKNIDEFKVVTIETIERGIEGDYKIFYFDKNGKGMISSTLSEANYYKVIG